ncbi:hypothetical protein MPSI1_002185 [Malassezia psittaci]|uniref:Multidrug resistance-associated protein/mitoxantrone resistance protein, ABC superfamily n=1 Tax=Malassezia psittaci TaxID=1821823 RepID=A0AAF0FF23_9BASI|nr:hypothetical protein MPSI1_002185 [Malassezia psittaci]
MANAWDAPATILQAECGICGLVVVYVVCRSLQYLVESRMYRRLSLSSAQYDSYRENPDADSPPQSPNQMVAHDIHQNSEAFLGQDAEMRPGQFPIQSDQDDSSACQELKVNPAMFWRRMAIWQHVLLLHTGLGLVLTLTHLRSEPSTIHVLAAYTALFLMATCLTWPPLTKLPSLRNTNRWRLICSMVIISFCIAFGELFRYSFGVPFSIRDWVATLNLGAIFCVAGCLPGQPKTVAISPEAVQLSEEDLDPTHSDHNRSSSGPDANDAHGNQEDQPPLVPVAPEAPIANSVLGLLFFAHFVPIIQLARRRGYLRAIDIPILGRKMQADWLASEVRDLLHRYVPGSVKTRTTSSSIPSDSRDVKLWSRDTRGILMMLFAANQTLFMAMFGLTIFAVGFYYAPSFFANRIFAVLEDDTLQNQPNRRLKEALPWVLGLFCTVIVSSTLQGQLWSILEASLTVRITTQLSTLMYNKTLLRRNDSNPNQDASSNSSQVMTLHLVDLKRVTKMLFDLFMLINVPFELLVGGYFAYVLLGKSALVGLSSTLVLIPLITIVSNKFSRTNEQLMSARDQRMGLLNESFLGIRMIKSQAWERRFDQRVQEKRGDELRRQQQSFLLQAVLATILELNPLIVTLVAFAHYTMICHNNLTPKLAFTSLAVFNELRWTLTLLPQSLTNILQALVSLRRICAFLVSNEVDASPATQQASLSAPLATVAFRQATISWPSTQQSSTCDFVLRDVSLEFATGQCNLICGRVGAGKSLLLQALLHEADVQSGEVMCPRSPWDAIPFDARSHKQALDALDTKRWLRSDMVAYAPQVPYLMNTTLRENILFGFPLGSGHRYERVLDACALRNDLQQLDQGDLTEVGENGMELSGGQKARIALARAVYSRASVLLLDDVFSAVDTHTAKHLTDRLLNSDLLHHRTTLLVSHNVQLVGKCMKRVIFMEQGSIAFQGSSSEFFESEHFKGLLDTEQSDVLEHAEESKMVSARMEAAKESRRTSEHREKGHIAWKVWKEYIQSANGWPLCIVTLALFTITNLWELVTNAWLREWSSKQTTSSHQNSWWLGWYVILATFGVVFGVLRWAGIYSMSLFASRRLFDKMLWRTLRAPLRFHDWMTRGGLLNRFGQDLEVLDSEFAQSIADVAVKTTQLLTTCIALYYVSGLQFVVALLLLTPVYTWLSQSYITTARDLQRLTSTSRSRVVNAFGNAVHGVMVLRAFGAQKKFTQQLNAVLNNNNRFVWWSAQGSRWISQMFNLVSAFLVLGSSVSILLQKYLDAPMADFSITFLIELNFTLLILMRMYTVFQTCGVAVERVFEFADTMDQEAPEFTDIIPPADWPSQGHVQVKDLCVKYASDQSDVLHRISFEIPPGRKFAVVGPTGSGKSTLVNTIFRFVEPQTGSITIDDIDVTKLGLTDLRQRLQIVPQDPVILSGSLRSILDVFDEFSDEQLLDSLRRVSLIENEKSCFNDLSFTIAEGGENLSQGQRQLLCLARAILRRSRVVLFDEASSSIDLETDLRITEVVQEAFGSSTVLTIAHRLRTVITYDQVLFMDKGKVAEIGNPHTLLQDPQSEFYKLCQSAGKAEFSFLSEAAREAHEKRLKRSS